MKDVRFEYECAMSGIVEPGGPKDDSDGLDDLPVGWMQIRFTRRRYNPAWIQIQHVKEHMIETVVAQTPPEQQDLQREFLAVQVAAQFYELEKDTPVFLPDVDDVVYVSYNEDVVESLNEVRAAVGLAPVEPLLDELPEEEPEDVEDEEEEDDDENLGEDTEDGPKSVDEIEETT